MKRALVLFLILCHGLVQASIGDYSLVFIHIGKKIPDYVDIALKQARSFNPDCPLILLANQEAWERFSEAFPQSDTTFISCESLEPSQHHKNFIRLSSLDNTWRGGFWRYTSERFLYLSDLMSQHQLRNVFHLEYDNMLYADVGEMVPFLEECYLGIGATFDNDERCIPGFVYISHPWVLEELSECFARHAEKNLNDMEILAIFKKERGREFIDHLPILPEEYLASYPLISDRGHRAKEGSKYCQYALELGAIFDGAAIGQYLGGIDPRNGPSKPGFINESALFNPSLLPIEWVVDERGRRVPYVVYPHRRYRINNLHIHSKHLEQFTSQPFISEAHG